MLLHCESEIRRSSRHRRILDAGDTTACVNLICSPKDITYATSARHITAHPFLPHEALSANLGIAVVSRLSVRSSVPSWILLHFKNDVTARCRLYSMSTTTIPNLVTISQTAAELLRFSVFQKGGRRHLAFDWILFSDHPRSLPDDWNYV